MSEKYHRSVLGDDWFYTYRHFRLNPKPFLDKWKLTRDAFCLNVLKDLYLDRIENQCKTCLLLLLQEHSSQLITERNLLEQIIGSLTNLCVLFDGKPDERLVKSQALITITTILLSSNLDSDLSGIMFSVKKTLLNIIYGGSEDCIVVSTACKCLEEIEMFHPLILQPELKTISATCENHLSPAFQSYVMLLSLCVKNMSIKLVNMKELQPSNEKSNEFKNVLDENVQIAPQVSFLLLLLPLMTHMAVHRVLQDLIYVVKHTDDLLPSTFKLFLPSLIMSSEAPLLHTAFDLLDSFGLTLFSAQEEKFLLHQLVSLSAHPCLSSFHRLLFLEWLKSCLMNKASFSCPFPPLDILLPGPFDGPIMQEKKSCLLALTVPSNIDKTLGIELLNESASGLKKCALLPGGTKAAASFFRTLFVYFSTQKTELMHDTMYKLLVGIMKTSPLLSPYALSFLHSVKVQCKERTFCMKALSHLVDHILSISMKQFKSNLEYYLAILESAAQERGLVCKPRSILRLLQKLLTETNCDKENMWCIGNEILSVCQTFLQFHDVQVFYYDLAEVLCLVMQNLDDVDVKDRAKIYYSMLTSLSELKVQSIFKQQTSEKDAKNAFNSFVPGGDSNLQFASCIQKLPKPVLQIVKGTKSWEIKSDEASDKTLSLSGAEILEIYHKHLLTYEPIVILPFIIKHANDARKPYSDMYDVVISTHSSPLCKEISVIEIPVFEQLKNSKQETVVHLTLKPAEPHPLTLYFRAEFTCSDGYSYCCRLPSVNLNFEDLFLPLPLPQKIVNCNAAGRQHLFEILWNTFQQQASLGVKESNYCESSFSLNIRKEELPLLIEEKWKPFIMGKLPPGIYLVAIYLPPRSHLLMKIGIVNGMPFMNIIVDNISLLPWASLYLQQIKKKSVNVTN